MWFFNKNQHLASRLLKAYRKYKSAEKALKEARALLLGNCRGGAFTTRNGTVRIIDTKKDVLDMQAVTKALTKEQLAQVSAIKTNKLAKLVGQDLYKGMVKETTVNTTVLIKLED